MEKIFVYIKKIMPVKLFRVFQPAYHFLLNFVASLVYKNPSNELIVIGVTGTTGKTTSVALIAKTLEACGHKVGYTSTAMFNNGEREWLNDKKMTMIGRFFTQRILRQMVTNGCQYAIVETTSEGIRQFRHRFINYDILVFTGLYPEHIDSHGSFENYKKAKGELFAHLKRCDPKYVNEEGRVVKSESGIKKIDLNRVRKSVVVNGNDEHVDYFLSFWAERKIAIGVSDSEYRVSDGTENIDKILAGDIRASNKGISFVCNNTEFNLQLLGLFNVSNAMTAVGVCLTQDFEMAKIKNGLEEVSGVPGRLERIDEGQDFVVIVDYAFEPNAVAKLYEVVKMIPRNNIIHVLGATGGGRDVARRPELGKLAGINANFVIITNEDPYDDDPEIIMDQVALGAEKAGKKIGKNLFKVLDRREAIEMAIRFACKDDIVLITGKGSEQAICVANGEKIKWDDRVVAREVLRGK